MLNFNSLTIWANQDVRIGVFCLLTYVVVLFAKKTIQKKLIKISQKTTNKLDDILAKIPTVISSWTIFAIIALFGLKIAQAQTSYITTIKILMLLLLCRDSIKISKILAEGIFHVKVKPTKRNKTIFIAIEKMIVVTVAAIFILIILSELGFNISAILAGLGLGGIALALAVKNILEDIISAISIYLDQPFSIGDFVVIGDLKGEVKKIGLKSTVLISYEGAETVISNKEITSKIIENYGRLQNRVHRYKIGVDYETSQKKLVEIPLEIEKIINRIDDCKFQTCFLSDFNSSSLDFTIIFQYTKGSYVDFVKTLEKVNLGILDYFKQAKINIPYPTIQIKK